MSDLLSLFIASTIIMFRFVDFRQLETATNARTTKSIREYNSVLKCSNEPVLSVLMITHYVRSILVLF